MHECTESVKWGLTYVKKVSNEDPRGEWGPGPGPHFHFAAWRENGSTNWCSHLAKTWSGTCFWLHMGNFFARSSCGNFIPGIVTAYIQHKHTYEKVPKSINATKMHLIELEIALRGSFLKGRHFNTVAARVMIFFALCSSLQAVFHSASAFVVQNVQGMSNCCRNLAKLPFEWVMIFDPPTLPTHETYPRLLSKRLTFVQQCLPHQAIWKQSNIFMGGEKKMGVTHGPRAYKYIFSKSLRG